MFRFEAPRAGEAAAAGLHRLGLDAHLAQQLELGIDPSRRLVVAMPPDEGVALERRRLDLERLEELGEVVDVAREPRGVVVVREQLSELLLEDCDAARLQADDGDVLAIPLAQPVEVPPQVALGEVEEAVVVQRPAAADVPLRDDDLPSRVLYRLDRRHADVRVEVVVERVRVEDDLAPAAGCAFRRAAGTSAGASAARTSACSRRCDMPAAALNSLRERPSRVHEARHERGGAGGLVD